MPRAAREALLASIDVPRLTDRFMAEGKLPNFQKLADSGAYSKLRTTFPSVSPVAFSAFAVRMVWAMRSSVMP